MSPRSPCLLLALALTACSEPDASLDPDAACAGRNVVLVVIDTLRADRLPFHGCYEVDAPTLSALARDGVVFENAWSTSSWTAPATASIFTGLYPDRHGVRTGLYLYENLAERGRASRLNRLPPAVTTLPELFRALGYRTFGIADNPNVCERMGFERGFDRFHTAGYEGAEAVNAKLAEWVAELERSEPWFLYLHYMDPHAPYHERAPWYEEPADGASELERDLEAYDSEISYVDAALGEALAALPEVDAALVVVTADHGEEFGDHGGREHSPKLYGELTRVPLVVRLPSGVERARERVTTDASIVDVVSTLCGLLGVSAPELTEGVDLSPALLDRTATSPERPIFSMRVREVPGRELERWSALDGGSRLIRSRPGDRAELYDVTVDRAEQNDLRQERRSEVRRLEELLTEFRARPLEVERSFAPPAVTSDEDAALLERLGYTGDEPNDE